jgi:hypothetical protein
MPTPTGEAIIAYVLQAREIYFNEKRYGPFRLVAPVDLVEILASRYFPTSVPNHVTILGRILAIEGITEVAFQKSAKEMTLEYHTGQAGLRGGN